MSWLRSNSADSHDHPITKLDESPRCLQRHWRLHLLVPTAAPACRTVHAENPSYFYSHSTLFWDPGLSHQFIKLVFFTIEPSTSSASARQCE